MPGASPQIRLVPSARQMRFGKCDAYSLEFATVATKFVGAGGFGQPVENMFGQKFGRGVEAFEFWQLVQISIIQGSQCCLERFMCAADVDHNAVLVERFGVKSRIDDEGGTVRRL